MKYIRTLEYSIFDKESEIGNISGTVEIIDTIFRWEGTERIEEKAESLEGSIHLNQKDEGTAGNYRVFEIDPSKIQNADKFKFYVKAEFKIPMHGNKILKYTQSFGPTSPPGTLDDSPELDIFIDKAYEILNEIVQKEIK